MTQATANGYIHNTVHNKTSFGRWALKRWLFMGCSSKNLGSISSTHMVAHKHLQLQSHRIPLLVCRPHRKKYVLK
ncbi:mCG147859 [Mus musculus]|nr:mCG147859 [Mus musculus]